MIFENLPAAYDNGPKDPRARENMGTAACMAGMAFANAFLGFCHSIAHKLGAFHQLPHGVANALMIDEVLRFNAVEIPRKRRNATRWVPSFFHVLCTLISEEILVPTGNRKRLLFIQGHHSDG